MSDSVNATVAKPVNSRMVHRVSETLIEDRKNSS